MLLELKENVQRETLLPKDSTIKKKKLISSIICAINVIVWQVSLVGIDAVLHSLLLRVKGQISPALT